MVFFSLNLYGLSLQENIKSFLENDNKFVLKNNKNIYKKYILNSGKNSSNKIDLNNYLNYIHNYNETKYNNNEGQNLLKKVLAYLEILKIQTKIEILISNKNFIETLPIYKFDNDLKLHHNLLVKKIEKNLKIEKELDLTHIIGSKNTNLCEPIISEIKTPETINDLILVILKNNDMIKNKINKINNFLKGKNRSNVIFLKNFKISSNFKKISNSNFSEKEIIKYVNNQWMIKYKNLFLNKSEKLFLSQVENDLKKTTKKALKTIIDNYRNYKSYKNKLSILNHNLIKIKNKLKNEKYNDKVVGLLQKKYEIEIELLSSKFSVMKSYYIIINGYLNLKESILSSSQKKCQNKIFIPKSKKIIPLIDNENNFLDFPENYYTINLATYKSFNRAKKFANIEKISDKVIIYSIDFNNDLIKVIYGIYATYKDAKIAKDSLSKRLLRHSPTIQKLIKHQSLYIKYNNTRSY